MPAVPNYPSEPVSDAPEPSEHRFIAPIVGPDPDWATAELEAHGDIPQMVITEHFAWAHMGKSGGDATARMFAAVPGLVEWASSPVTDAKHDPFAASCGGRSLDVCES